ncbi:MAG: Gfo/Idh/MocA family oxidoreductase [Caldilineaceae bacterium]
MSELLKVGLIGVGGIARTHMPGWRRRPTRRLWPAATSGAALATWAATYGVDRTSTDPADIINDPDIDIIDVCTPNMVHESWSSPRWTRASTSSARSRWRPRPTPSAA